MYEPFDVSTDFIANDILLASTRTRNHTKVIKTLGLQSEEHQSLVTFILCMVCTRLLTFNVFIGRERQRNSERGAEETK